MGWLFLTLVQLFPALPVFGNYTTGGHFLQKDVVLSTSNITKNFREAATICAVKQNSTLPSAVDIEWLQEEMTSRSIHSAWVDVNVSSYLQWVDGIQNMISIAVDKGNCAIVRDNKLQTVSCLSNRTFICQNVSDTTQNWCGNGTVTWPMAQTECQHQDGSLAVAWFPDDLEAIGQIPCLQTDGVNDGAWVGLRRVSSIDYVEGNIEILIRCRVREYLMTTTQLCVVYHSNGACSHVPCQEEHQFLCLTTSFTSTDAANASIEEYGPTKYSTNDEEYRLMIKLIAVLSGAFLLVILLLVAAKASCVIRKDKRKHRDKEKAYERATTKREVDLNRFLARERSLLEDPAATHLETFLGTDGLADKVRYHGQSTVAASVHRDPLVSSPLNLMNFKDGKVFNHHDQQYEMIEGGQDEAEYTNTSAIAGTLEPQVYSAVHKRDTYANVNKLGEVEDRTSKLLYGNVSTTFPLKSAPQPPDKDKSDLPQASNSIDKNKFKLMQYPRGLARSFGNLLKDATVPRWSRSSTKMSSCQSLSPRLRTDEIFDFRLWASTNKLSSTTVDSLRHQELVSYEALRAFRDEFDQTVGKLKLTLGQQVLLKRGIKQL